MALLVVPAELCTGRGSPVFHSVFSLRCEFVRHATAHEAPRAEILCFGDSLTEGGVQPRVLQARLGRPAYNLAMPGQPPYVSYFLLRRALASGARPAAVVVDFAPSMCASDPRELCTEVTDLLGLRDCLDLAWATGDGSVCGSLLFSWLLPTLRHRHEIRAEVWQHVGRKRQPPPHLPLASLWRNWEANRGAFAVPQSLGDLPGEPLSPPWVCDPVTAGYIERFLALATAHRLSVFVLVPPSVPDLQDRYDRQGITSAYTSFLRSLQAEFPSVTVLDGRHSGYPRSAFGDLVHLDWKGACTLSRGLADVLARPPDEKGGPRWIDLPVYRNSPVENLVEDLTQSLRFVQAGAGRRS
jgi:hypothetical protein